MLVVGAHSVALLVTHTPQTLLSVVHVWCLKVSVPSSADMWKYGGSADSIYAVCSRLCCGVSMHTCRWVSASTCGSCATLRVRHSSWQWPLRLRLSSAARRNTTPFAALHVFLHCLPALSSWQSRSPGRVGVCCMLHYLHYLQLVKPRRALALWHLLLWIARLLQSGTMHAHWLWSISLIRIVHHCGALRW